MTDSKVTEESEYVKSALKAGLSAKAGTVYVSLLEAGTPLSPKAIILRSHLHRQYVYDALKELASRSLIVTVGKGRRILYQATSPDHLLQEAEKARIDVLDATTELMRLYDRSPAGVVEILHGGKRVIDDDFQLLHDAEEGEVLDIIGGGGNHWVALIGDRITEWEELRKQKKVSIRYIGTEEDVRHNREESIIPNESRVIPGIGNIITVTISSKSVSFDFYEPEVLSVRVKNPAAVASQRALFETLWGIAK
jgi:sugar-specific transcriptional regulator TrmB